MMSVIRNTLSWLIVLALFTGCSGKKDSSGDDKPADGKTPSTKDGKPGDGKKDGDLRTAKPDFTLTSREFDAEEKKNRDAATEKFQNKLVEMTGVVGGGGTGQLQLEGVRFPNAILCLTSDPDAWKKATPGKTVKLRGRGKVVGVALDECEIIEVTGPPPVALTADQLAKELMSDTEGVKKKYDKKWFLISGEFASINLQEATVNFQTTMPKPVVSVFFGFAGIDNLKKLMKGQQLTVLCQFWGDFSTSELIQLREGNIWK